MTDTELYKLLNDAGVDFNTIEIFERSRIIIVEVEEEKIQTPKTSEELVEELLEKWVDSKSLDELIGFYKEVTRNNLRDEGDEDIKGYAEAHGISLTHEIEELL